jgi:hypothetical protein
MNAKCIGNTCRELGLSYSHAGSKVGLEYIGIRYLAHFQMMHQKFLILTCSISQLPIATLLA